MNREATIQLTADEKAVGNVLYANSQTTKRAVCYGVDKVYREVKL